MRGGHKSELTSVFGSSGRLSASHLMHPFLQRMHCAGLTHLVIYVSGSSRPRVGPNIPSAYPPHPRCENGCWRTPYILFLIGLRPPSFVVSSIVFEGCLIALRLRCISCSVITKTGLNLAPLVALYLAFQIYIILAPSIVHVSPWGLWLEGLPC